MSCPIIYRSVPDIQEDRILQAKPFKSKILSVGLDSSEMDWPPKLFQEAFELALKQGYRLSAHAGKRSSALFPSVSSCKFKGRGGLESLLKISQQMNDVNCLCIA